MIPFVSGVLAWQGMLNLETGWVNEFLGSSASRTRRTGSRTRRWSTRASCSSGCGGSAPASSSTSPACEGIPTELYDAAQIDGAGWWAPLRNVTLPLMSPVIFYSLILGIVDVLQYFLVPLVLYNGTGEPGGSTLFFNLLLYKQAFNFQNFVVRRDARLAAVRDHARDHPGRVPDARAAGSTTRASAEPCDVAAAGPELGRAAGPPAAPHQAEGGRQVVPVHVRRRRRPRGVPVADHPVGLVSLRTPEQVGQLDAPP